MEDALSKMAQGVLKPASGLAIGPTSEEGYIPRSIRVVDIVNKCGAKRAIDMLLDKLAGRPFSTEIPLENFIESIEETPIAKPIINIRDAYLAFASSAGLYPVGNPYGFQRAKNIKWAKYPID
jgi:glycine reductase